MELEQLDVKTTFLHGRLEKEILMQKLEGFEVEKMKMKKSGSSKKMADAKAVASAGMDKAKTAAVVGAQKVKSGTSAGLKWVKNQYQKRTSK